MQTQYYKLLNQKDKEFLLDLMYKENDRLADENMKLKKVVLHLSSKKKNKEAGDKIQWQN